MIKVKIEGEQYHLPTDWRDVTYEQYIRIIGAVESQQSPLSTLSAITGIDEAILGGCSVNDLTNFFDLTSFVRTQSLDSFKVIDKEFQVNIGDMPYLKYEVCRNEINSKWRELYPDKKQLSQYELNHVYMAAAPVFVKEYLDLDISDKPIPAVYGLAVFFSIAFQSSTTHTVS